MKYRPEIDGLRAVAVVPVIFFHAGFSLFSGGFVGVDIFFVISGYLITSIILSELQQGTFSLVSFYERRARRILPALFFVMLACLPFAWMWMLPSDLKNFSRSLAAVSVYASNFLFWKESGYFDTAGELKPLLHTWSLAVEEQYYLLFPALLLLTWKFGKKNLLMILVFLGLASLALAQFGSINKINATYYLLPTRGFELLIGSFVAFLHASKVDIHDWLLRQRKFAEALALTGLIFVTYAIFAFGKDTPFPGLYAVIPTVGTALVIGFGTRETIVGRALSRRWLVGIGLISYSAYLWHQPLLAFARLRSVEDMSLTLLFSLVTASFLIAFFTWKFIERPFRDRQNINRKNLFVLSVVFSLLMITIGLVGNAKEGFPFRKLADGSHFGELDKRVQINNGLNEACDDKFTLSPLCRTSDEPEVLVWGDSLAMHLVQGVIASKQNVKLIQMTKSVCGPFVGLTPFNSTRYSEQWAKECMEFNNQVMHWIGESASLKYVVLGSMFEQYTSNGWSFLTENGVIGFDKDIALKYLLNTLEALEKKGIKPIVVAPPPTNGEDIGRCLVKTTLFGSDPSRCDISWGDSAERQAAVIKLLSEVSKRYRVIWLADEICSGGICNAKGGSYFVYRDARHLSKEGSAYLGREMHFYEMITAPQITAPKN